MKCSAILLNLHVLQNNIQFMPKTFSYHIMRAGSIWTTSFINGISNKYGLHYLTIRLLTSNPKGTLRKTK